MIDNVTRTLDGATTSRVAGLTLTHTRTCGLHTRTARSPMWRWNDLAEACDCFVSKVKTVRLPDGTETACFHDHQQIFAAIRGFQRATDSAIGQAVHWKKEASWQEGLADRWRGAAITAMILAAGGWAVAAAHALGWY
ncbi:hypothetical protein PP641_gp005 [Arthrobacter phage SilentRX]|uniref:Uncharacterized protein n=1 Tax=Arthrobacter phage SilentRX TaxID=2836091 RepID=A0A8F3ECM9_9CAUD|nr:hypothetical protein PP641_gp005 [Arthrobacter phage SilentRX]QWY82751.1 hypothetical protein SEA_SILENTRX_5 [Arthrobacter phage SilentRX]